MNICLAWDPAKRPTCVDVLQHPYFQARTASRRPLLHLIPTIAGWNAFRSIRRAVQAA